MPTPAEQTKAVSDPASETYDPQSSYYDVTIDSSSPFYVGPFEGDQALSGDEIRAEIAAEVMNDPLASELSEKQLDAEIQNRYLDAVQNARQGLGDGLDLREAGEAPRTVWDNASHEQMAGILNSNADSVAIAETSEEWVGLGNELTVHQRSVADSINDSMGNWSGEGGNAARNHLTEVAKWLGYTADGAVLTGRQQQIHSQTLNESQKRMAANPPVPFSAHEANAQLQQTTDPVAYAAAAGRVIQTMQQQQAAREQAARIMTQFDDTVGSAINMPLFSAPPPLATKTARLAANRAGTPGGGTDAASRSRVRAGTDPAQAQHLATPGAGDAAHAARQLPNVPAASGPDGTGGQHLPLSAQGGQGAGGGSPGAGNLPGAGNVPGRQVPQIRPFNQGGTHATGNGGSMPTPPPVRVPDLPTPSPSSHPNNPNLPGVNVPGGGTSASSYKPPNYDSPEYKSRFGPGKNPSLGWSGGVNGDSIASRLGGLGGGGGAAGGGSLPPTGFGGAAGSGATGAGGGASGGGAISGAARGLGGEGAPGRGMPTVPGQEGTRGTSSGMAPGMGAGGKPGEEDKERRAAGYLDADDDLFATEEVIAPPVIGDWKNNKDGNWK